MASVISPYLWITGACWLLAGVALLILVLLPPRCGTGVLLISVAMIAAGLLGLSLASAFH